MKYFITIIIFTILANHLFAQSQAEKDSINALFSEEPFPFKFYPCTKQPKMIDDWDTNMCSPQAMLNEYIYHSNYSFRALIDEEGCCIQYVRLNPEKGPKSLINFADCLGKQILYIRFTPAYQENKAIKYWTTVPLIIDYQ